jgi:hypothetical protein
MMTMVVEENRPRRRTSTSVSSGNGSVDLACDRDSYSLNDDKPTAIQNSTQQQWSAISTVLVLASLLLFALYVSAGRWKGARSHIGDFLAGTSDEAAGMPSLGIFLHPEDHRSRDAGIITLHWTITSDLRAPDGVKKSVYLINGNFAFPLCYTPSISTNLSYIHVKGAFGSVLDSVCLRRTLNALCSFSLFESHPFQLSKDNHSMTCTRITRLLSYLPKPKDTAFSSRETTMLTHCKGEFPGPTIEARSGDTLIVHVENALSSPDDGVSLHWHGLFMKGFNNMDGAVGFTQCPIPPGRNFTYEFRIGDDQYGTFWYHAHSQVQRGDGLYGGLVVHRPHDKGIIEAEQHGYQNEVLLLVGDWYHRSARDMLAWYTSVGAFGNEVRSLDLP